jgi:hypothetical protein
MSRYEDRPETQLMLRHLGVLLRWQIVKQLEGQLDGPISAQVGEGLWRRLRWEVAHSLTNQLKKDLKND